MPVVPDSNPSSVMRRIFHVLRVLARHKLLGTLFGRKRLPPPKAVREAIEELGLTYIKFGQVLAMQRGLLPDAYIEELALLHDQVPAMDIATVHTIIQAELGEPVDALYSEFSKTPLGAASIAQVHDATLWDGRRVAVKVQRPNLSEIIAKDIAALNYLVSLGEKFIPRLRALDLPAALHEMATGLMRETDFSREANSIAIFRNRMTEYPDVWIPEVISAHTRGAVLTMEFSAGERIDAYARQHPEAMPQAMNTLVRLMMQTIFEDGLFHADPHPGNVFILPDGRLSLLDFGSTGELDERMRDALTVLLESVINGDAQAATVAYLEMTPETENVNRVSLQNDIKAALYEIRRPSAAGMSIGNVFEALVRAGTRNGVRNPGEFVLMSRAVVILESMIRQITPNHDYMGSFQEQYSRLTVKHLSVGRIKDKTGKIARDIARLMSDGPSDTRRILRRMSEGDLGRLPRLEAMAERLSRNVERLAGSIIYAALVVSGALLSLAPNGGGGRHFVSSIMTTIGIIGMLVTIIGAARRS